MLVRFSCGCPWITAVKPQICGCGFDYDTQNHGFAAAYVPVNNYFGQINTYAPPPSLQQITPEGNHFEPQYTVREISSGRSYYSYQTPTNPATSTPTVAASRLSSPSPIGTDCYFSTSTPRTDLRLGHPTCTHIFSATDT